MIQEVITAVNSLYVVTGTGKKTPIGNQNFEVGQTVWTDGNYIFGNETKSNFVAPVMTTGVADANQYFIWQGVTDSGMSFRIYNAATMAYTEFTGTINGGQFVYNSTGTAFAWIGVGGSGANIQTYKLTATGYTDFTITLPYADYDGSYNIDGYIDDSGDIYYSIYLNNFEYERYYTMTGEVFNTSGVVVLLKYKNDELISTKDYTSTIKSQHDSIYAKCLNMSGGADLSIAYTDINTPTVENLEATTALSGFFIWDWTLYIEFSYSFIIDPYVGVILGSFASDAEAQTYAGAQLGAIGLAVAGIIYKNTTSGKFRIYNNSYVWKDYDATTQAYNKPDISSSVDVIAYDTGTIKTSISASSSIYIKTDLVSRVEEQDVYKFYAGIDTGVLHSNGPNYYYWWMLENANAGNIWVQGDYYIDENLTVIQDVDSYSVSSNKLTCRDKTYHYNYSQIGVADYEHAYEGAWAYETKTANIAPVAYVDNQLHTANICNCGNGYTFEEQPAWGDANGYTPALFLLKNNSWEFDVNDLVDSYTDFAKPPQVTILDNDRILFLNRPNNKLYVITLSTKEYTLLSDTYTDNCRIPVIEGQTQAELIKILTKIPT